MDYGKIIFEELNEWVYNETNEAGEKLHVIDASDLHKIIPEIVKKLNEPAVSKCESFEREPLLFAFISWYAEKYEMIFTTDFKNRLIDEFKSKQ